MMSDFHSGSVTTLKGQGDAKRGKGFWILNVYSFAANQAQGKNTLPACALHLSACGHAQAGADRPFGLVVKIIFSYVVLDKLESGSQIFYRRQGPKKGRGGDSYGAGEMGSREGTR